jgi:hypothetical protein
MNEKSESFKNNSFNNKCNNCIGTQNKNIYIIK